MESEAFGERQTSDFGLRTSENPKSGVRSPESGVRGARGGQKTSLGTFDTALEAAITYAKFRQHGDAEQREGEREETAEEETAWT